MGLSRLKFPCKIAQIGKKIGVEKLDGYYHSQHSESVAERNEESLVDHYMGLVTLPSV